MILFSHTHINGNGPRNNKFNVEMVINVCKRYHYSHTVLGCHCLWLVPPVLMRFVKGNGITPIRYVEIDVINPVRKDNRNSHVQLINIPFQDLRPQGKSTCGPFTIEDVNFLKQFTKCKVILAHPKSEEEIMYFVDKRILDGIETLNGLKNPNIPKYEEIAKKHALKEFHGADYHTWEYRGDCSLYTELPDRYFGEIYG